MDRESRTLSYLADYLKSSSMVLQNFMADREAETRALGFCREERIKNLFQVRIGNPRSRIFHFHTDPTFVF